MKRCFPHRRRRSAFTLIEVIVGFTLTVLLFSLFFQFLIPALKISTRTTERAETEQQAVIALRNMIKEIETTSLFGVSFRSDGSLVAVHPVTMVTQNNDRVYADHLVVYKFEKDHNQIVRYTWKDKDDPSIDSPRKLSSKELDDIEAHFQPDSRVLVRGVEEFEFTHSGVGDLIKQPFKVRLKMGHQTGDGSREFELVRAISMRNQI